MRLRTLTEFVKIEHTLFALPFVVAGTILGFEQVGIPFDLRVFLLVLVAATAARTLGMTLNRIVDKAIDARNPRTATRALPAGTMSMTTAVTLALVAGAALVGSAALLNELVLLLSPVLVLLFFLYPYAKRLTWACHFVLGLAFLCAPAGGYLAVTGSFDGWLAPFLLGLAAMAWVSGFDIIYGLLDVDFDRRHGIHSIPADLGLTNARRIAAALHLATILLLAFFAAFAAPQWPMLLALLVVGALLTFEHARLDPSDPAAVNKAFFHVNAAVGWLVLAGLLAARFVA